MGGSSDWRRATFSDSQIFRQPDLRFVINFFKAAETVKGKPVDGNRTDFTDERLIERRAAAFFVNECEHDGASGLSDNELVKPFHVLRTAQAMVAWNQIEFDGKGTIFVQELFDELLAASRKDHAILQAMQDRRVHRPEPIKAGLPIGFAFFDPLPR